MKLIVISSPIAVPNEHKIIHSLFEEGMKNFHIHKPSYSKEETEKFIQEIAKKYHNKIALHSDFPKCHSLKELESLLLTSSKRMGTIDFVFLSPIFDSISKVGYKSTFDLNEVKLFLQKCKALPEGKDLGEALIALGGIDEDKIKIVRKIGFAGVAVVGAIWNNSSPIEKFKKLKVLCEKKDLVF